MDKVEVENPIIQVDKTLESNKIVSATTKYIRISPTKIAPFLEKIRGKHYVQVLAIVLTFPRKVGKRIWQTVFSAASNASHNVGMEKENLRIQEAFINQGPILKRMRPRAKGRGYAIQKKMSHLTIRVEKSIFIPRRKALSKMTLPVVNLPPQIEIQEQIIPREEIFVLPENLLMPKEVVVQREEVLVG